MIINVTLDYNPDTNECKVISTEKSTAVRKTKKAANNDTLEPTIILDTNKYILNEAATKVLGVQWGDKLCINYEARDGISYPLIASSKVFGTESGNKLTKGLTVSCRGAANTFLARYGSEFTLTATDQEGLYIMSGSEIVKEEIPENIEIVGDIKIVEDNNNIDLPFTAKIDDEDVTEISADSFNLD